MELKDLDISLKFIIDFHKENDFVVQFTDIKDYLKDAYDTTIDTERTQTIINQLVKDELIERVKTSNEKVFVFRPTYDGLIFSKDKTYTKERNKNKYASWIKIGIFVAGLFVTMIFGLSKDYINGLNQNKKEIQMILQDRRILVDSLKTNLKFEIKSPDTLKVIL